MSRKINLFKLLLPAMSIITLPTSIISCQIFPGETNKPSQTQNLWEIIYSENFWSNNLRATKENPKAADIDFWMTLTMPIASYILNKPNLLNKLEKISNPNNNLLIDSSKFEEDLNVLEIFKKELESTGKISDLNIQILLSNYDKLKKIFNFSKFFFQRKANKNRFDSEFTNFLNSRNSDDVINFVISYQLFNNLFNLVKWNTKLNPITVKSADLFIKLIKEINDNTKTLKEQLKIFANKNFKLLQNIKKSILDFLLDENLFPWISNENVNAFFSLESFPEKLDPTKTSDIFLYKFSYETFKHLVNFINNWINPLLKICDKTTPIFDKNSLNDYLQDIKETKISDLLSIEALILRFAFSTTTKKVIESTKNVEMPIIRQFPTKKFALDYLENYLQKENTYKVFDSNNRKLIEKTVKLIDVFKFHYKK